MIHIKGCYSNGATSALGHTELPQGSPWHSADDVRTADSSQRVAPDSRRVQAVPVQLPVLHQLAPAC